jgi:hypothetical protein
MWIEEHTQKSLSEFNLPLLFFSAEKKRRQKKRHRALSAQ